MVAIGDDVKGMLDLARPMFALYIGGMGARGKNFYNDLACQYGYEEEAAKIQDLYLGGNKRDAEAVVPLELLEMCNLVGPASYVQERIAAFREAGVTNLQVMPVPADGGDPAALVAQVEGVGGLMRAPPRRSSTTEHEAFRRTVRSFLEQGGRPAPRAVGGRRPGQPRGVDAGRRAGPALLRRRRGVRRRRASRTSATTWCSPRR